MAKNQQYTIDQQETIGAIKTAIQYIQKAIEENKDEVKSIRQSIEKQTVVIAKLGPISEKLNDHEARIRVVEKTVDDLADNQEKIAADVNHLLELENEKIANKKKLNWLVITAVVGVFGNLISFVFNIIQSFIIQ